MYIHTHLCIYIGGPAAREAPYVKKWTRNRHAIMFQLSNKIVQVGQTCAMERGKVGGMREGKEKCDMNDRRGWTFENTDDR
eukprot:5712287-Pyramimonas_sp.AAC.1